MSAVVRVVPDADMEILDKYLSEEGVVLIPQSLAAEISPDAPQDVDELYLDGYHSPTIYSIIRKRNTICMKSNISNSEKSMRKERIFELFFKIWYISEHSIQHIAPLIGEW